MQDCGMEIIDADCFPTKFTRQPGTTNVLTIRSDTRACPRPKWLVFPGFLSER